MDTLRLGVIGCGTIASLNVPGYLKHDRCDVVALCDVVPERARKRAAEWGIEPKIYARYEDLLEDDQVHAVELLTPSHLHARQVVAALDAGKHVSCQKPVCNTLAEVSEIADAVRRAKTIFRVTENFIYYPPIVKAMELFESGIIGEPSLMRIRTLWGSFDRSGAIELADGAMEWRGDAGLNAGGLLFDDGWHKFATAMWWLGDAAKVFATVLRPRGFIQEAPSVITWQFKDRDCLGVFEFASGEGMPIRTKYYPLDEFFEIQGPAGTIWVTRCSGEMLDMAPVILVKGDQTVEYDVPSDWSEGFDGAARDFVDSVLDGRQPKMGLDFSERVLRTVLAAYRSSEIERPVDPTQVL